MPRADKRQRKKDNARQAREARLAAERRRRRFRAIRNGVVAVTVFVVIIVLINVFSSGNSKKTPPAAKTTATIKTNMGTIVVRLDTKNAPIASGRFVQLARKHFYDGLKFHRAAKDFVIQGGDPKGDGTGSSGTPPVVGELPTDHYPIGSIAAAKTPDAARGTFDCQFFIVTGREGATLPNDYARFGSVVSGLDVAQKIAALYPHNGTNDGPPTKTVIMQSVTISES